MGKPLAPRDRSTAWKEGWYAFYGNKPRSSCPYSAPKGSYSTVQWKSGWDEAKEKA